MRMRKDNIYYFFKMNVSILVHLYGLFGVTTVVAYEPPSQNVARSDAI